MYQLLIKTNFFGKVCLPACGTSITIIELVKSYHRQKESLVKIPETKVLGYLIVDLETDEIVERFYEPTS